MAEDCCAGTDTIGGTTRQIQIVQEAIREKVIRLSVSIAKVLAPNHQQQRDLQILKQASELSNMAPRLANPPHHIVVARAHGGAPLTRIPR